jgi:hypothetical protein
MTATLDAVASKTKDKPEPSAEQKAAEELVRLRPDPLRRPAGPVL